MKKIFLFILFIFLTNEETVVEIDLESSSLTSGTGYIVTDKLITFNQAGTYTLSNYSNRALRISSSQVTLNLNHIQVSSTGKMPALTLDKNCEATLMLMSTNVLMDTIENEKDGVIYMDEGAKLIITTKEIYENDDGLYIVLTPFKNMGIYGEASTNLIIDQGGQIMINPAEEGKGCILIGNDIIINDGIIEDNFELENEKNPSLKAGGSIIVKKGSFSLHSIQAGLNIYLGEQKINYSLENYIEDNDLGFGIETLNEGMKAKNIEIYSGQITIYSEKDSIVA